jgi:SAM-dependent methyltransferase
MNGMGPTRVIKSAANLFMRPWYTAIDRADVEGILHFMNYGYLDETETITLQERDEQERYPIQLYHHTASCVDLEGKDLLEIGCGRGGGLSYLFRYLKPASAHGVDLNGYAIRFCARSYPGIRFDVMDAQNLAFADDSFDAVINVESSHRYPSFRRFVKEVHRTLRPGGYSLFADFRFAGLIDGMINAIRKIGFRVIRLEEINRRFLPLYRPTPIDGWPW